MLRLFSNRNLHFLEVGDRMMKANSSLQGFLQLLFAYGYMTILDEAHRVYRDSFANSRCIA